MKKSDKWFSRARHYLSLLATKGMDEARQYRERFKRPEKLDAAAARLRKA